MMDGGEGEGSAARYYEVGVAGGFALGLEALGGESQAELDLHAARGLDEGVVALDVLDDLGHGHGGLATTTSIVRSVKSSSLLFLRLKYYFICILF